MAPQVYMSVLICKSRVHACCHTDVRSYNCAIMSSYQHAHACNHVLRHAHAQANSGGSSSNNPPALVFTLGVSRVEALRKVARLLDAGLPQLSLPQEGPPNPGAALVLRILALQVRA